MTDLRIDGDAVVYRAGFAADSRMGGLSHSLHNTKLIINMLKERFECMQPAIYLTSTDALKNFRSIICPSYKKNRSKSCRSCKKSCLRCNKKEDESLTHTCQNLEEMMEIQQAGDMLFRGFRCKTCGLYGIRDTKPVFYKEIRAYMCKKFGALICNWGEADDWLGADYTADTIIASHDKDLLMIPCRHYRLHKDQEIDASDPGMLQLIETEDNKGKIKKSLLGYGFVWFCAQMLSGDAVDNIPKPVKGFGPVKIYEYLSDKQTASEQWLAVCKFYREAGLTEDDMLLAGQLLWISRKAKEQFSFDLIYKEVLANEQTTNSNT